jgi:hypothetical protein
MMLNCGCAFQAACLPGSCQLSKYRMTQHGRTNCYAHAYSRTHSPASNSHVAIFQDILVREIYDALLPWLWLSGAAAPSRGGSTQDRRGGSGARQGQGQGPSLRQGEAVLAPSDERKRLPLNSTHISRILLGATSINYMLPQELLAGKLGRNLRVWLRTGTGHPTCQAVHGDNPIIPPLVAVHVKL